MLKNKIKNIGLKKWLLSGLEVLIIVALIVTPAILKKLDASNLKASILNANASEISEENLEYIYNALKKLDTNSARTSLLKSIEKRRNRMQLINLVKQNIQFQNQMHGSAPESQITKTPTYADLINELTKEVKLSELEFESVTDYKTLVQIIEENVFELNKTKLEEKWLNEQILIGIVKRDIDEFESKELYEKSSERKKLLEFLKQEIKLTKSIYRQRNAFESIYSHIESLRSSGRNDDENILFAKQKNMSEEELLLKLQNNFATANEQSKLLKNSEKKLFRMLESKNTDAVIKDLVQQINANKKIINIAQSYDFDFINQYLKDTHRLGSNIVKEFTKTVMSTNDEENSLKELMNFFESQNHYPHTKVFTEGDAFFKQYFEEGTEEEQKIIFSSQSIIENIKFTEEAIQEISQAVEDKIIDEEPDTDTQETPVEVSTEEDVAVSDEEVPTETQTDTQINEDAEVADEEDIAVVEEPEPEPTEEEELKPVAEEAPEEAMPEEEVIPEEAPVDVEVQENTEVVAKEEPEIIAEEPKPAEESTEETQAEVPINEETKVSDEEDIAVVEEPEPEPTEEEELKPVADEEPEISNKEDVAVSDEEVPTETQADAQINEEVAIADEENVEVVVEETPEVAIDEAEPIAEEPEITEEEPKPAKEDKKNDDEILELEKKARFDEITTTLLNEINIKKTDKSDVYEKLISLNLSNEDYDEWMSYLNELFFELNIEISDGFNGTIGALRFDEVSCERIKELDALDESEKEDLDRELTSTEIIQLQRTNRSDEIRKRKTLKKLKKLNKKFCLIESKKTTIKNLIDNKNIQKQISANDYKFVRSNISMDFKKTTTPEISITFQKNKNISAKDPNLDDVEGPAVTYKDLKEDATIKREQDEKKLKHSSFVPPKIIRQTIALKRIRKKETEKSYSMSVIDSLDNSESFFTPINGEETEDSVVYNSDDNRISDIYVYKNDPTAITPNRLKNYTIFNYGDGIEEEYFSFENSVLHLRKDGKIEGYFLEGIKLNIQGTSPELVGRATSVITKARAKEINKNGGKNPDFIIDAPFALDKNNLIIEPLTYEIVGENFNQIKINFETDMDLYPIVLDPTITFTAPGVTNAGSTIDGTNTSELFGISADSGDFNGDGIDDIVVGASSYSGGTGRVYIFYGGGDLPTDNSTADITLTGASTTSFGASVKVADFDGDGTGDLIVGGSGYLNNTGRAYIFYNDGSMPTTAATADVIITGEASSNDFGTEIEVSDLDQDGTLDLIVGADRYSSNTGRSYIFYNDGSMPTTAATADVIITGEASSRFGSAITTGDLDNDGTPDVVIGGYNQNSGTGKAYIFYNDGSMPTTAATADVIITGEGTFTYFGYALTTGDLDNDGDADLAVGAYRGTSYTGKAYIFYNDGSMPTTAATADVIITGEGTNYSFGQNLLIADVNNDTKKDLVVSAPAYNTNSGKLYFFYNDGTYPTASGSADKIITGQTNANMGIFALVSADLNNDGTLDVIAGGHGYATNLGRTYIFYGEGGGIGNGNNIVSGESSSGLALANTYGDLNNDGLMDIASGAYNYSSGKGRVYLFYGGKKTPNSATNADVIITGTTANDRFGLTLKTADMNDDGLTDLIVGADQNAGSAPGKVYIFYQPSAGFSSTIAATSADIIITGQTNGDNFGAYGLTIGDFNADGSSDIAVGAFGYSTNTGRAYIFYNDGSFGTVTCTTTCSASNADVIITGGTSYSLGIALESGDFNSDGMDDIAVGATGYSSSTGSAYIYYQPSGGYSTSLTTGNANVTLTGQSTSNRFGTMFSANDFNGDGRTDLAIGADGYSTNVGRIYIFNQPSSGYSASISATSADSIITGEASSRIGYIGGLTSGDYNNDGLIDIAGGAFIYNSSTGRSYVFYQPTLGFSSAINASAADVIITGEATSNYFGSGMISGDFNKDGEDDIVIGAYGYSTNAGRLYFFSGQNNYTSNNEHSYPPNLNLNEGYAFEISGGTSGNYFGYSHASGDFDRNGKIDLAIGAYGETSSTGKVYMFLNDGQFANSDSGADAIISGANTGDEFGKTLASGKVSTLEDTYDDLLIGAPGYSTGTGRVYLFNGRSTWNATYAATDANNTFDGISTGDKFGTAIIGKTDLSTTPDSKQDIMIGATGVNSGDGSVYIFYNDGTYGSADITIAGATGTAEAFGSNFATGELSTTADYRDDIVIGAPNYSTNTGRAYLIFNDGTYPSDSSTADYTFTGGATGDYFGSSIAIGEISDTRDVREDLVIGAPGVSTNAGATYIYYNDGAAYTTADITITGEAGSNFGNSIAIGDITRNGRSDIIIGANAYSSNQGRIYIFNNDNSIPTTATSADMILEGQIGSNFGYRLDIADYNRNGWNGIMTNGYSYNSNKGRAYVYNFNTNAISGDASSSFGYSVTSGDLNADGIKDIIVGAYAHTSSTGRVYIFYGPNTKRFLSTSNADVTITGEGVSDQFGIKVLTGDMDNDGDDDLIVAGDLNEKVYIFYNDGTGTYATSATSADVIIASEAGVNRFGQYMTLADINSDGNEDLIITANRNSSDTGKVYIFYNDGSFGTVACTTGCLAANADIKITGESGRFGSAVTTGDFNNNGKPDLAIGAFTYGSSTGRGYIFYNDGSIPTTAASADVIISGETGSRVGVSATAGDVDNDGDDDLVFGGDYSGSGNGKAYVFYNDGSYPTTAATADDTITGENSGDLFAINLGTADMNNDGKTDLIIGAQNYGTNKGRIYTFFNRDKAYIASSATIADEFYTGESADSLVSTWQDDLNGDGKTDVIIGASGNSKVYVNYGEITALPSPPMVSITSLASDATSAYWDVIDDSATDLVIGSETADECRWSTSEITESNYSSATACSTPSAESSTCSFGNLTETASATRYFRCKYAGSQISTGTDTSITFGVDLTTPSTPTISSTTHPSQSTYYSDTTIDFSWTDVDTGPSAGTYYYCIDQADTCDPSTQDTDRIVAGASIALGTNYIRVKNCDLFACSAVASYTALTDTTIPADPTITCSGFTDGAWASGSSTTCTWDDTAGPSAGTYAYCSDTLNTCSPTGDDIDQSVVLSSLINGHTYFRVQTTDTAGSSNVVSFDIANNAQPELTAVATDDGTPSNTIEPGDQITFRGTITDADTSPLVSMSVCSDGSTFNGSSDPCSGGTVICSSIDQSPGTLTCQAATTYSDIPEPHGSTNYKIFAYDTWQEAVYTAASAQTWTITDVAPVVSNVAITTSPFTLTAGSTTPFGWTATITDGNGDGDIVSGNGVIYDGNRVTNTCDANEKNCYLDSACTLGGIDGDDTATATCSVNMNYNANAGTNWIGRVTATDESSSHSAESGAGEISTLLGLDIRDSSNTTGANINYGTLTPNSNTSTLNKPVYVANVGNKSFDVQLYGTELCNQWTTAYSNCGGSSVAVTNQEWSTFNNVSYANGINVEAQANKSCIDTNVKVKISGSEIPRNKPVYFGLQMGNVPSGSYTGQNTFTATSTACNTPLSDAIFYQTFDRFAEPPLTTDSNIISYWKMDDGTGSTVTDSVGSNNGTITGAVFGGTGAFNYANDDSLTFNGGDSVDFGDDLFDALNTGSVEIWAKVDDLTETRYLWSYADSSDSNNLIGFSLNTAGKFRYQFYDDSSNNLIYEGDTVITAGNWAHAVIVSDGSNFKIYVNGVLQTLTKVSGTGSNTGQWFNDLVTSGRTHHFEIGRLFRNGSSNSATEWDGALENLIIYNDELTADEIADHYQSSVKLYRPNAEDDNLIAYYDFDEGTGSTATDIYGVNDGTITAATYSGSGAFGYSGDDSLTFDGTGDYITVADSDDFSFGNGTTDSPFSVQAWVTPSTSTANGGIFGKWKADSGGEEYLVFLTSGKLRFFIEDASSQGRIGRMVSTGSALSANTTYLVTVTYDGSGTNAGLKIFVDGMQVDDANSSSGSFTAMENTTTPFKIGRYINSLSENKDFNGKIDNVVIYNDARTPAEIYQDYINGIMSFSGPTLSQGSYSYSGDDAYSFNGNADFIDLGDVDALDGATTFTIEGWNKQDTVDTNNTFLISKFNTTTNRIYIAPWSDGKTYVEVSNGSGSYGTFTTANYITAGQWYHWAMVYNGAGATNADKLKYYVDGVEIAMTYTGTIPTTSPNNSQEFTIGARDNLGTNSVDGDIDNIVIYDIALTATEVLYRYNAGP